MAMDSIKTVSSQSRPSNDTANSTQTGTTASSRAEYLNKTTPIEANSSDSTSMTEPETVLGSVKKNITRMDHPSESDRSYQTDIDTIPPSEFPEVRVSGSWPMMIGTILEIPITIEVPPNRELNEEALEKIPDDHCMDEVGSTDSETSPIAEIIKDLGGVPLYPNSRIALIGFTPAQTHLLRTILNESGELKVLQYNGPEGGDRKDLDNYQFEIQGKLAALAESLDYDPGFEDEFPIVEIHIDNTIEKSDPLPKIPESGVKIGYRPFPEEGKTAQEERQSLTSFIKIRSPDKMPEVSKDLSRSERKRIKRENVEQYGQILSHSFAYIRQSLESKHAIDGMSSIGSGQSSDLPPWETLGR